MTKMPEQRAVRLVKCLAPPLPLSVVRLGDVDGDDAAGVAGQRGRIAGVRGVGQEFKRQAAVGILGFAHERQPEAEHTVDQPPLGDFESIPGVSLPRLREIGNDPREPARSTEILLVVRENGPITDVGLPVVPTQAVRPPFGRRER